MGENPEKFHLHQYEDERARMRQRDAVSTLNSEPVITNTMYFIPSISLLTIARVSKTWDHYATRELHSRGPFLNFSFGAYCPFSISGIYTSIRFYKENNYVCTMSSNGALHLILRWFHRGNPNNSKGTYNYEWKGKKCYINFDSVSPKGIVRYSGLCTTTTLQLDIKSLINGNERKDIYHFNIPNELVEEWPNGQLPNKINNNQKR